MRRVKRSLRKATWPLAPVLILALAGTLLPARAAFAFDVTQWEYARRVSSGPPGWTVMELDGPVLAGAQADLGDLRVVDETKREIPWTELPRAAGEPARYPARLFNLVTDEETGRTSFTLDLGKAGILTNGVVLSTTSHDFLKRVTFEVSSDLETWSRHVGREGEYIYDLEAKGGGASLVVPYPETSYRYIRVIIDDLGTPPLAGLGAEIVRVTPPAAEERPVPAAVLAQGIKGNDTWAILDLGYAGIPVTRLALSTSATYFQRAVTVEGSPDRVAWVLVARNAIYRLGPAGTAGWPGTAGTDGAATGGAEQLGFSFPEATYRYYRVTVLSGDDPPITPESIELSGPPRRVLFKRTGPEQVFLLYGNPAAVRPRYDPAQFTEPGAAAPATATLGRQLTVITEPEPVAPAAEETKSDADPRLWRFERPLDPSAALMNGNGQTVGPAAPFVAVTLDQAILAAARPDLGDLRLVDADGHDLPYLVRTDASLPASAWPFKVANAGATQSGVWWVLDLGAENTPSQILRLETSGTNLIRELTVTGSNDGQAWAGVTQGVVRRVDTIFGLEENLVVTYPTARYRYLRVEVGREAGDSPELFKPAEVKGFLPAIVFRPESGQAYRLFYGNPAAAARLYPAELFLDAYAPVRLGPEALGPVTDHSPPPKRPWFLAPGEGTGATGPAAAWLRWGLWALLAVGVAAIGVVTAHVLRAVVARERIKEE